MYEGRLKVILLLLQVITCKGHDAVVSLSAGDDIFNFFFFKTEFWYGRGKILVAKNYTLGCEKKIQNP